MQLPLYSPKGIKLDKNVTVPDDVFKAKIHTTLLRQALYVYSLNQKQATAQTKTKSQVRGGGAKPWAQKGSGRARAGSIRSPIWKGGGVVFGPDTSRNYKKKLTKKMKKVAIRSAFSSIAQEDKLFIVENVEIKNGQLTKQVLSLVDKLPVKGSVLFIQGGENTNLYLGARNVKNIDVTSVFEINVYDLIKHESVIILQNAIAKIEEFWGKEKKEVSVERSGKKSMSEDEKKKTEHKEIQLPTRIKNVLDKKGLTSRKQVEEHLKKGEKIEGIGEKSLEEIKKAYSIS